MATITTNLLLSLFTQCAIDVAPETLHTLIGVESSKNPYAIAVVYGKEVEEKDKLKFKQPNTEAEALEIIDKLNNNPSPLHKSYSVGLMQVNSSNLKIRFTNNSSTFLGDSTDYYFNIDFGKETQSDFYFKHPSQDIWHSIYCNTLNAKDRVIAQGEIISSGDITAFSDIRLKTNIEKIENALDKVCQLSGYTYDMNNKRSTGVIAQEVEKVLPEVVQDREDGYKTVAYGNMIGLLIEAIKELKEEIKVIKNGN